MGALDMFTNTYHKFALLVSPRFTKARPTQKYELGRVAAEMVLQRLNNCRMTPPDDSARCRLKW